MTKYLSARELQLAELEILKKTVKILEKYSLRYTLAAGTLLGAIRHQGFIPWDDDIDIMMPRPDYEKLISLADQFSKNLHLEAELYYPFTKVIDRNIVIESKSNKDTNLWIDIFPIDGLPDDEESSAKHIKKTLFWKGVLYEQNTSFSKIFHEKKSLKNRIVKAILKPIAHLIPNRSIVKIMVKNAKRYDFDQSSFAGAFVWGYGPKERMPQNSFLKYKKASFEKRQFSVITNHHEYLTNIYGDYMKLPPKDQRITHKIKAKKA